MATPRRALPLGANLSFAWHAARAGNPVGLRLWRSVVASHEGALPGRAVPDYALLFAALPTPYVVMTPELVIVEPNDAYLASTGRSRESLVGRGLFEAFPPDPATVDETGKGPIQLSLERVRVTGRTESLPISRFPIVDADGVLSDRFWLLVAAPVFDSDGNLVLLVQRTEDVTEFMTERERAAGRRDPDVDADWQRRAEQFESDLFALANDLAVALEAKDEVARQISRVAEVSLALTQAWTVEDLERIVIDRGLSVLGADGGAVVAAVPNGGWRMTVNDALGEEVQTKYAYVDHDSWLPACWTARTGIRLLLPTRAAGLDFNPAMGTVYDDTGRDAWAMLPLTIGDERLGALAVSWVHEHPFLPGELDILDGFAAQCAQTLQRIQVTETQQRNAARVQELAGALQQALLTPPPQVDHLQIEVRYRSAADEAQVGGDWYDAFNAADGATMLVIGDVMGHDEIAAARMGQLRGLLRTLAYSTDDTPAAILTNTEHVARGLAVQAMATIIVARIEQQTGPLTGQARTLRWSNAGHPPPVLLHPDGHTELLAAPRADLLLGVEPSAPRRDHDVALPDNATLLLYTDGLIERRGRDLDEGLADLRTALDGLADTPLEELCDTVLARLAPHTGEDDIAVLAVRNTPLTDR